MLLNAAKCTGLQLNYRFLVTELLRENQQDQQGEDGGGGKSCRFGHIK